MAIFPIISNLLQTTYMPSIVGGFWVMAHYVLILVCWPTQAFLYH